ncbi:MAG: EAL domain-containing protein [Spirochaetales bacterium]|nr:EAL domain-containing protein [Spirochaetales bacterium]
MSESIPRFPTFAETLDILKQRLITDFKIGMILIDTRSLRNIEYSYGKTIYENVFAVLMQAINSLNETHNIGKDDIITIDQQEGSFFYIFFAKQRDNKEFGVSDYENISERFRIYINNSMFHTVFPSLKEKPCVTTGYSIAFHDPSIKEERILQTMIEEAQVIAHYHGMRNSMINKEKVYELIINKKLETYYQPIVNIQTHQIMGYEALSRGPKNTEYENPHVLFNIAKKIGLLYELDWLCKINIFQDAKKLSGNNKLFVNVFSSSIHDSKMRVKYLEDLLADTDIKPNDVVFEISERYAIEDSDFFNEITRLYTNTSFAIAIDDSWIGSNIALLKNLKIHYIKLNMSLIRNLDQHKLSRELIISLLSIAEKVGAEIIAEGIQTMTELRSLVELGIVYGQGYLFAGPGPAFPEVNVTEMYLGDDMLRGRLLASVFFKRGMDYFQKGQFDESILEFSKVLEIDENNVEALYHKAHAFYEDACYGAAIKDISLLLSMKPDHINAYFTKALTLEKIDKYDESIDAYVHYITHAPAIYQSNIDVAKKRVDVLLKKKASDGKS